MKIIILLVSLLAVTWLMLTQFKATNHISTINGLTDQKILVPQNGQDLEQLKNDVNAQIQKSADNTQRQIDEATNPEKTN
jgi:hypothetical protein